MGMGESGAGSTVQCAPQKTSPAGATSQAKAKVWNLSKRPFFLCLLLASSNSTGHELPGFPEIAGARAGGELHFLAASAGP